MAPRLSDDRGWVDPKGYSTYDITMSVLSNAEMFGRQRQHFSRPPPKPDPEPQLLSSDTYEQFTDISADYSPDLMCLTEPGTNAVTAFDLWSNIGYDDLDMSNNCPPENASPTSCPPENASPTSCPPENASPTSCSPENASPISCQNAFGGTSLMSLRCCISAINAESIEGLMRIAPYICKKDILVTASTFGMHFGLDQSLQILHGLKTLFPEAVLAIKSVMDVDMASSVVKFELSTNLFCFGGEAKCIEYGSKICQVDFTWDDEMKQFLQSCEQSEQQQENASHTMPPSVVTMDELWYTTEVDGDPLPTKPSCGDYDFKHPVVKTDDMSDTNSLPSLRIGSGDVTSGSAPTDQPAAHRVPDIVGHVPPPTTDLGPPDLGPMETPLLAPIQFMFTPNNPLTSDHSPLGCLLSPLKLVNEPSPREGPPSPTSRSLRASPQSALEFPSILTPPSILGKRTEREEEPVYSCAYCGTKKTSTSAASDGRVRIRCKCGGKYNDNKPRLHANWKRVTESELL